VKIDLHVHTKKCKQGDAQTREVSASDFSDIVLATQVKIIAITNHNVFDIDQYQEIVEKAKGEIQVWPGIELDVIEEGRRGHLLVISSPNQVKEFSEKVESITVGSTPDSFSVSIDETIKVFDDLGPLYIAHYKQKKPDISEVALEKLMKSTEYPNRVIKEVSNSISAGIYISHGHPSIYGSDVQDWSKYEDESVDLPDLRLPVESFEQFCLLLEKDAITINTALNKKTSDDLVLYPSDRSSEVKIKTYNDINVFFGSKGTGKSCLLESIKKHFSDKGIAASVFASGDVKLEEVYDIKGSDLVVNLETHDIEYCIDEIKFIKNAVEVDITSINNYVSYFQKEVSNKSAKNILLKDFKHEDEVKLKRVFDDYDVSNKQVESFLDFLSKSKPVSEVMKGEEVEDIVLKLSNLQDKLNENLLNKFIQWKENKLLNSAVEKFKHEISRKTGAPSKPSTTGFKKYALNRIEMEVKAKKVFDNIKKQISEQTEIVGNIGVDKGDLVCKTILKIQDGSNTDGSLATYDGLNKTPKKDFANGIERITKKVYTEELFEEITNLNNIEGIEGIKTISELLLFKKYFSMNGSEYAPSSGEASMLMLQKELREDKDVYILDEPEKSLGNDYINDVIVPLIKEKARLGKKIFISTHDANIAVRTLPYCSIYRCHNSGGYNTYYGNPFSNNLININDEDDKLDWKIVSMKTLEGGEKAFGERGKIYGNI
jgi:predicted ATPase